MAFNRRPKDRQSRPPPPVTAEKPNESLAILAELPTPEWDDRWSRIFTPPGLKDHLLGQALLSMTMRNELASVGTAVHGLILLSGRPGNGKTTLCHGVANELAKELRRGRGKGRLKTTFGRIDPHALPTELLGQSQRAVRRLFDVEIASLVQPGQPVVLLVDEVESFAVSRSEASLKANPADVHGATNAVLDGLDEAAGAHPNLLILATTNFSKGVDEAFISRADAVIEIPDPDQAGAQEILQDTLLEYGKKWPALGALAVNKDLVKVADKATGLSGRALRKLVMRAAASTIELARDPGAMTIGNLLEVVNEARALEEGKVAKNHGD